MPATLAQGAYQRAMVATGSPRSIEAAAFERVNSGLRRAESLASNDYPAFIAALSRNLGLWNILAADVASDTNALPLEVRASIWKLSVFVRNYTQSLMKAKTKLALAPLIEINANMISGLLSSNGAVTR